MINKQKSQMVKVLDMKRRWFCLLLGLLLWMPRLPAVLADQWVLVHNADELRRALSDPAITHVRLMQDVELPPEGLVINDEKESLTLEGADATLYSVEKGLIVETNQKAGREIRFTSITLDADGEAPLVSVEGEGKPVAISLWGATFKGNTLVSNPTGTLTVHASALRPLVSIGVAKEILFTGETTLVRENTPQAVTGMLQMAGDARKGGGTFTLAENCLLQVQDGSGNASGFLESLAPGGLVTLGAGSSLSFEGSGAFCTGQSLEVVRLQENAALRTDMLGNLALPLVTVHGSFLVDQGASVLLTAPENTQPLPLLLVTQGGKVSFSKPKEILLFNGCRTAAQGGLVLAYEGKKGLWLNQTQLVELWNCESDAFIGALGTPDGQWRNGAGGVYKMDATITTEGYVTGLKVSDYTGKIELSKQTLLLQNARVLRVAMEDEPEILLAPAETPKPEGYDRPSYTRTPNPDWDEDGNFIGGSDGGSSGGEGQGGSRDPSEYDSGFVDLE